MPRGIAAKFTFDSVFINSEHGYVPGPKSGFDTSQNHRLLSRIFDLELADRCVSLPGSIFLVDSVWSCRPAGHDLKWAPDLTGVMPASLSSSTCREARMQQVHVWWKRAAERPEWA